MTAPRSILFVGDTHCGSLYGVWPKRLLGENLHDISGPRYLADCWEHHLGRVAELCPGGMDLLVLTGDLIEGKNRKAAAAGLFTPTLGHQVEGAIDLLKPLAAMARRTIRVDGTGYHEEFDEALIALDYALGVAKKRQVFDLQLPGGILNIAHHPAGGSAIYQGTKLDKEAVWADVAAQRRQVPHARWIVRAHLHNFAYQATATKTVCLLPCWKLADFHAKKLNYWAFQPTIGSVLMQADDTEPGGYRFRLLDYELPQPAINAVEDFDAAAG